MRLLDTDTGQFVVVYDVANVNYAILSHTWDQDGEQTYQEVKEIQERHPIDATFPNAPSSSSSRDDPKTRLANSATIWDDCKLSAKIRNACRIARQHGYRYLWIDSCCIDKSSSSELSEAINSMYDWYGRSAICYAFLADVPSTLSPHSKGSAFRFSRWFQRGWTLQELIAPRRVVFLSGDWSVLGLKSTMAPLIEAITGISREVLTRQVSLDDVSVARRMSWAATRCTTRVEDRAYSLLGIFNLNMPALYGEGQLAFRRLQEEILRRVPDQSLFVWGGIHRSLPLLIPDKRTDAVSTDHNVDGFYFHPRHCTSLFASSPFDFKDSGSVSTVPEDAYLRLLDISELPQTGYPSTPYGIQAAFPMIPLCECFPPTSSSPMDHSFDIAEWYLVILRCDRPLNSRSGGTSRAEPHLLARACRLVSSPSRLERLTAGEVTLSNVYGSPGPVTSAVFALSERQLSHLRPCLKIRFVHLPHPDRVIPTPPPPALGSVGVMRLELSLSTDAILRSYGYHVEFLRPGGGYLSWTYSLILQNASHILQLNIDDLFDSNGPILSAAAWVFSTDAAVCDRLPLSTFQDDHAPHRATRYRPGVGFPTMVLREPRTGNPLVLCLQLEEAADSAEASFFLHVDVDESDWVYEKATEDASGIEDLRGIVSTWVAELDKNGITLPRIIVDDCSPSSTPTFPPHSKIHSPPTEEDDTGWQTFPAGASTPRAPGRSDNRVALRIHTNSFQSLAEDADQDESYDESSTECTGESQLDDESMSGSELSVANCETDGAASTEQFKTRPKSTRAAAIAAEKFTEAAVETARPLKKRKRKDDGSDSRTKRSKEARAAAPALTAGSGSGTETSEPVVAGDG